MEFTKCEQSTDNDIFQFYTADFEYIAGLGDLDQCNGRDGVTPEFPNGTYYYVITDSYPGIPRCFVGTPSLDFKIGP